jgi:hypothetical protein
MTAVRLHSSSVRAGAVFEVPILSWTAEIPSRFFRAVYYALNELLYIQPGDLFALSGPSLGDCSVALRIFGGNSTLTLRPNAAIVEFPNTNSDRSEFVDWVVFNGYKALKSEFSEVVIGSIEANAGFHLEFIGDDTAHEVLVENSRHAELAKRAIGLAEVVIEPGVQFRLVDKDGKWNCRATLENSYLVENGVYLFREIVISDLSDYQTVEQQFELIHQINQNILAVVGLELETQENGRN